MRLAIAGAVGVGCGVGTSLAWPSVEAGLVGWDATALTYLLLTWLTIWRLDGDRTRRLAVAEDQTRGWTDALLSFAAVASLAGLGLLLRVSRGGNARLQDLGVGLAGVLLSWALIHTIFTLRYARLFYGEEHGGIDFKERSAPAYSDFAYLAFTVGMTFQVSDTDLTTRSMRATVLRHALVSYLFGAVIVAMTINLLSQLAR